MLSLKERTKLKENGERDNLHTYNISCITNGSHCSKLCIRATRFERCNAEAVDTGPGLSGISVRQNCTSFFSLLKTE